MALTRIQDHRERLIFCGKETSGVIGFNRLLDANSLAVVVLDLIRGFCVLVTLIIAPLL